MEGSFGIRELKALQDLIHPPQDNSDTEDDLPQAGARKLGESNFRDLFLVFCCTLFVLHCYNNDFY